MNKSFVPLLLSLLIGVQVSGQERVTIKAGGNIEQAITTGRYLFPEFQNARVFKQNQSVDAKMNYNALSGEMEFIAPTGEILALKDNVQTIVIGNRFFRQTTRGYLELIAGDAPNPELLVHLKYRAGDVQKHGAYGTTSSTTAIDTYSSISTDMGITSLTLGQDITYTKTYTYYLYANGKYVLANKAGFTKVFGKKRPGLQDYIKSSSVDFSKEEELIRLLSYCTE